MAYDLCKVSIIGRLVADPRMGEANQKTTCNCRVAATVGFGDNQQSSFVSFTLWDKLADAVGPKLQKGDKVYVSGDLVLKEYETNGEKRSSMKIRFVDDFILLTDTRDRPDTGERPKGDGREFGARDEFNPPRGGQQRGGGASPFGQRR